MSVTMEEVLALPSLKGAQVVAGRTALTRPVTSVTVLEYSQPSTIQTELYQHIKFNTDEIILTSFASIRHDSVAQCRNIETLSAAGELGIIWFYVGIIVPEISSEVLALADRLDFLIICMPKNEPQLTYSSVISEILYSVYNDQLVNPNFATELIEEVSAMPSYQQNLDMVNRLLSNRLKISIALIDQQHNLISAQKWPPINPSNWTQLLEKSTSAERLKVELSPTRQVILFKEYGQLSQIVQKQVVETLKIALNLWDHHTITNNQAAELITALVQKQPQRVAQLGKVLKLESTDLQQLLIVHPLMTVQHPTQYQQVMAKLATDYAGPTICEWYRDELLLIPVTKRLDYREWEMWQSALTTVVESVPILSTRFTNLTTNSDFSVAYALNQSQLRACHQIFPQQPNFTANELNFTADCQELIEHSVDNLTPALRRLRSLSAELLKTLSVFLLDARGNVEITAQQLYVHRNTAKYRLSKLDDYYGFKITGMPESFELYQLVAINRLLTRAD